MKNIKWKNKAGSKAYYAWRNMNRRCTNQKDSSYKRYGGRGISVCTEWRHDYDAFYYDMAGGFKDGLQLDRTNNNGNYSKDNCRWVTVKENQNNRNNNVVINHNGIKKTISEWADHLNLSRKELAKVYKRYSFYGVDDYDSLFSKTHLATQRLALRHSECKECGRTETCKWRSDGTVCNTCYCRNLRRSKNER